MKRWGARILAMLMLLGFILLMLNLENQLVRIQKQRGGTSTSDSR
jgi:hypothetical protein